MAFLQDVNLGKEALVKENARYVLIHWAIAIFAEHLFGQAQEGGSDLLSVGLEAFFRIALPSLSAATPKAGDSRVREMVR
jgi:hypothetical protein